MRSLLCAFLVMLSVVNAKSQKWPHGNYYLVAVKPLEMKAPIRINPKDKYYNILSFSFRGGDFSITADSAGKRITINGVYNVDVNYKMVITLDNKETFKSSIMYDDNGVLILNNDGILSYYIKDLKE